jgi:hypothetical protein
LLTRFGGRTPDCLLAFSGFRRLTVSLTLGIVKWVNKRLWLRLACILAAGLALLWGAALGRPSKSKSWLVVSKPLLGSVTNGEIPIATVTFLISNVGPRAAEFQVSWFECRAKIDRGLLATSRTHGLSLALDSGTFTNLIMNIPAITRPPEEYSCCCMVDWIVRRAAWREVRDRVATWVLGLVDVSWLPWQQEELIAGYAVAANVDLSDHFRSVYGWTREQWLEEVRARATSVGATSFRKVTLRQPTFEETVVFDARRAFVSFCQNSTDSAREAEPVAPPNAASPHR